MNNNNFFSFKKKGKEKEKEKKKKKKTKKKDLYISHQKSKTGVPVAPKKDMCPPKTLKKKKKD